MSATTIMTTKCLRTLFWWYIRCLYDLRSALVLTLHERVRIPPRYAHNLALNLLNGDMLGCKKEIFTTSIVTSKYLHTLHGLYIWCLYQSGSALLLILYERVRLPPQNTKVPAMKPWNGGTLGCKKGWATLQLWLPSVCIHCIGYI